MDSNHKQLSESYARHRGVHPGVLQRLLERGALTSASRLLEIGCGTGNYLIALYEATGCAAIGIDPSAAMLARARARDPSIAWLIGRGEALPLRPQSVDLLFSVDVIHHVEDRPAMFREAQRVLAPGGLICTVTDSADDIRRRRPLSSRFPETVRLELARYPAVETLTGEMAGAGFTEIATERVELAYDLSDPQPYRDRAFSSLHLIPDDAVERGLRRLDAELIHGPVPALSLYTLIWGRVPRNGPMR